MLDAREVRLSGMLIGYAKEELSLEEMEEVAKLLSHDLELGQELERIFILLENSAKE